MKIIQIASGDLWAGAEVQLYHLSRFLQRQEGIELLVILLNSGQLADTLIKEGVSVQVIPESKNSFFSLYQKIKLVAREFSPDLIHSHRIKENILTGLVAKQLNCATCRTAHGADEFNKGMLDLRSKILSFADWFNTRFLQRNIISVSDELASKLRNIYPKSKIVTISNSIDIDYVKQQAEMLDPELRDMAKIKLGFVGRFVDVKRVQLLVEALVELFNLRPDLDLHVLMVGDGPLYEEIKAIIAKFSLEDKIQLLGFLENPAPVIKELDYLIFTSKHEGLPMTLLEAMALNTAIISTELPTIHKVLKGDYSGYFITSEAQDMAKKILDIVADNALRDTKAKRAYEILESEYSVENNGNKYISLYQHLI